MNKIAVTEKTPSRVLLHWVSSDSVNEFFTIERSSNQRDFEIMAVLHVPSLGAEMEWSDESPLPGKLVYRLKTTQKNGNQSFGASIEVLIDNRNSLRIYPNPVDNVLIIRSEYPVDLTILDANGKLRLTAPNITGLQLVNVESLEKGIYLLRTYNRILNTLTTDRLIKN
ncbi:MAG: T9SS type A sorting domain-containing protein [Chitinophagaceae bacterium]